MCVGVLIRRRGRSPSLSNSLGRVLYRIHLPAKTLPRSSGWVLTCGPQLAFVPRPDPSTQARGAHVVVAGLVSWLVALAVLSRVPGGVQADKPRPQHTLPFFPYRYGLPSARWGHAMATAADGSVWGFGGSTVDGLLSDELLKLDLRVRQWHAVTTPGPRPSGRKGHTMAAVANGTRLLVFGGDTIFTGGASMSLDSSGDLTFSDEAWTFNLLNAEWSQLAAGASGAWPRGRYGHAMAVVSATRVVVFGGWTDIPEEPKDGADLYEPKLSDEAWIFELLNAEWTKLNGAHSTWPRGRSGHTMAAVSATRVILFGGETTLGRSDELWSLDIPSITWTQLTAGASGVWPSKRYLHTMAVVSPTIVLMFGGYGYGSSTWIDVPGSKRPDQRTCLCGRPRTLFGEYTDELWSLDVSNTTWTQLTAGALSAWPSKRAYHAMAVVSDTRVILFGGYAHSRTACIGRPADSGKNAFCHISDELFSFDFIAADSHTVRATLLNDENVTADEMWDQFNTVQVHAVL